MNLIPYIGQYIKIITQDQNWFIGKLIQVYGHESENSLECEFDIITFNNDSKHNRGIDSLKIDEIRGIEELEPKTLQGLIITLNNVPNIIKTYQLINSDEQPKKIEFGKKEQNE